MHLRKISFNNSVIILVFSLFLFTSACEVLGGKDKKTTFNAGSILFISDKSGNNQLYSMEEDGSHIQQLTNDSNFPVHEAKWSPDGKMIAVISEVGDDDIYPAFRRAIFVMNADGSERYQLTSQWVSIHDETFGNLEYGGAFNLVWSSDSKQILYSKLMVPEAFGNMDIFSINLNGTNEIRLSETINYSERVSDQNISTSTFWGDILDYSARDSLGQGIQYTRLVLFDSEGIILESWGELGESWQLPVLSKGKNKISFIYVDQNYKHEVYIMNSDGSDIMNLTNGVCKYPRPVAWSSDDSRILLHCYEESKKGHKVFTLKIDGTKVEDITPFEAGYLFTVSWK